MQFCMRIGIYKQGEKLIKNMLTLKNVYFPSTHFKLIKRQTVIM